MATNNSLSEWDKLELLGTGGNGEVWRAKRNGVECAVKILKKTKVDDESYRRFIDEIKILRDLGHDPGVLPILDVYLPESPSKRNRAWLTARTTDRTKGLEKRLQERAEKEAKDIESILLELKQAIESELHEPEYRQMELFSDPEKDQFERNKDFLRNRVTQIPDEIKRETEAIRARYLDPQARMFPVAVTFLVPRKLAGDSP